MRRIYVQQSMHTRTKARACRCAFGRRAFALGALALLASISTFVLLPFHSAAQTALTPL